MQISRNQTRRLPWAPSLVLVLMLAACGPAKPAPTPTTSVEQIYTAAVQTFQAQQATQLALTPPTSTPSPTLVPTLPPVSPIATLSFSIPTVGGVTGGCDSATYVADVTVPDGTIMAAGQAFDKTWKIQNAGSCTWSTSYTIAFVGGNQMGGAATAVKVPVPPGNQTQMTVSLKAPTAAGSYTGQWRMLNAGGAAFGNTLTVVISVGTGATVTPGPSPTGGVGTINITGSAGVVGATVDYSGTTTGSVTADDAGNYTITVPSGWSGTITPSKGNVGKWVFSPTSQSFTNLTSNTTFNFSATQGSLSPTPTP